MRRRDLLKLVGSGAICWALSARAQQPSKTYRLGYLASARIPNLIEALQTGLRELGYVEGKTSSRPKIDMYWARGSPF